VETEVGGESRVIIIMIGRLAFCGEQTFSACDLMLGWEWRRINQISFDKRVDLFICTNLRGAARRQAIFIVYLKCMAEFQFRKTSA
jgi:hypothetical protein